MTLACRRAVIRRITRFFSPRRALNADVGGTHRLARKCLRENLWMTRRRPSPRSAAIVAASRLAWIPDLRRELRDVHTAIAHPHYDRTRATTAAPRIREECDRSDDPPTLGVTSHCNSRAIRRALHAGPATRSTRREPHSRRSMFAREPTLARSPSHIENARIYAQSQFEIREIHEGPLSLFANSNAFRRARLSRNVY